MDIHQPTFNQALRRFQKVVVWGLRTEYHTHRYIHAGFFRTLKKLGVPVVWTDYDLKKSDLVKKGDLVISSLVQGRGVKECRLPVVPGAYYCLHNFDAAVTGAIDPKFLVNLQVYTNKAEAADQKWDEVTFFDTKTQTLYQPWGTSLLAEEFKKPAFNTHGVVFWVGSVWDNALRQGNVEQIRELKDALVKYNLKFSTMRFVPDWLNVFLIRYSRLAPAIAGRWQAENNYLPCRMFKNISFGQLGFSNVEKFRDIYKDCSIAGGTIAELVSSAVSMSKKDYLDLIWRQQEITKGHTYAQKLSNVIKAFEII